MAGGSNGREREVAEMKRRIVELRDQDWEFREIAAEVGRDVSTVWRHYQRAMRAIPAAAIEEHQKKVAQRLDEQLRRIDMERELLDEILGAVHVIVSNGIVVRPIVGRDENGKPKYGEPLADVDPILKAIKQHQGLDDQEAKLLGLYPKQTISVERPTSEVDAAVIGYIEAAKAKAAAREARLREVGGS